MSSIDASLTSGYYSEIALNNVGSVDQPDVSNLDRIIFDSADQERPPFTLRCCCTDSRIDRSLVLILIHYLILLGVIIFCIIYLTLCNLESKLATGILALLSACVGHVLPGPKS